MVELKCKCGGKIFNLMTLTDPRHQQVTLFGCTNCHKLWWDADVNPLTQEKLDKYDC